MRVVGGGDVDDLHSRSRERVKMNTKYGRVALYMLQATSLSSSLLDSPPLGSTVSFLPPIRHWVHEKVKSAPCQTQEGPRFASPRCFHLPHLLENGSTLLSQSPPQSLRFVADAFLSLRNSR